MNDGPNAITIVGAVFLGIILVGACILLFTNAQKSITGDVDSFSAREAEAFNSQFETFSGKKKGTDLSLLITRLIANANNNSNMIEKIPAVTVSNKINKDAQKGETVDSPENSSEVKRYNQKLVTIKQNIEDKHEYNIEFNYNTSGFISEFVITY